MAVVGGMKPVLCNRLSGCLPTTSVISSWRRLGHYAFITDAGRQEITVF